MIHRINLTEYEGNALIAAITVHIPDWESLGRIRAVTRHGVVTDAGMWGLARTGDRVWRVVTVRDGWVETTIFRDGGEVSRGILRPSAGD